MRGTTSGEKRTGQTQQPVNTKTLMERIVRPIKEMKKGSNLKNKRFKVTVEITNTEVKSLHVENYRILVTYFP